MFSFSRALHMMKQGKMVMSFYGVFRIKNNRLQYLGSDKNWRDATVNNGMLLLNDWEEYKEGYDDNC